MASQPFQFKEFTIAQDRCAAKIGTDGVLLGAWTSLNREPDSILDIGTGTGVIALMLAQRSIAQTIDALELEDNAYEQASENFENSQWGDRLFCYHAHLHEFALEMDEQYDHIVCNPPFYKNAYQTEDQARNQARFEDAMPFNLIVGAIMRLLSQKGTFAIILPFEEEEDFIKLCAQGKLIPSRITRVRGNAKAPIKRSLIEFRFQESSSSSIENTHNTHPQHTELIIEKERHVYTEQYLNLVQDFYLRM